jgi:uncharacterized protein involved in exopolysaccharide biosynthesis
VNIIQFLRILWARRLLIAFCTVLTLVGATVVVLLAEPRYEATARVNLGLLKPDVLTGQDSIALRNASYFIDTQRELLKDYRVTAPVVDALGWSTNPQKIAQYNSRPATDTRDFRHWLAQQVADRVKTGAVSGSILEISFDAPTAVEARTGADALRTSFLDYSLTSRRQEAARTAKWYTAQAEQQRQLAEQAELSKAAFERENGLVMQGDSNGDARDVDSARLAALVSQAASATAAPRAPVSISSQASLELAQIDAQIAQSSAKLGPNHPEMQQLKARRALVESVVSQERASARAASGDNGAAVVRALEQQKARVISQRDKVERLRQLQASVDLNREQYKKTAARAAELNLEAGIADTGMTAFGVVVTPDSPAFPKKFLILGGAIGLGLGLGLVVSVLMELLFRRVRGIEELNGDRDPSLHCLAVISPSNPPTARTGRVIPLPRLLGANARAA